MSTIAERANLEALVFVRRLTAYLRESAFGGLNIFLVALSAAAGVWKFRKRRAAAAEVGKGPP